MSARFFFHLAQLPYLLQSTVKGFPGAVFPTTQVQEGFSWPAMPRGIGLNCFRELLPSQRRQEARRPPALKVETSSQYGTRVKQTRTDTSLGGGGRLEFGKFREQIEQAARVVGWEFVYDVV